MDTVIKRKSRKIQISAIGGAIILALATLAFISATKKKALNVASGELLIKEVKSDYFEDFIIFQAKAEPLNSLLVNIIEGGSVQEIFVENGAMVQKGQALARMYNPNTELGYLTQETAIIEQINNLSSAKLNIRNQEINLTKDLVMIEHDYNDASRQHDINERLFKKDIISRNEYQASLENLRYQKRRMEDIQNNIRREKNTNRIQVEQIGRSIATMEKSLEILRDNKKNFLITAPESGRLTSFDAILGQHYQAGQSIGKIDKMDGYKLVAQVDEFYLERLSEGQKGEVEFKGQILPVMVSKVLPEVRNGRFQAELEFEAGKGQQLQQGLSLGVKLILSGRQKSIVLPKGAFHQETAGKWVFVVNGSSAERREIKTGRENPFYYEILEGLKPGERVVTSSYDQYAEIEVLNINK